MLLIFCILNYCKKIDDLEFKTASSYDKADSLEFKPLPYWEDWEIIEVNNNNTSPLIYKEYKQQPKQK